MFGDIEDLTLRNNNYRKVISTGKYQQLVLMSLKPLQEIGLEKHNHTDQFIRIEKGVALAQVGDEKKVIRGGDFIHVTAGTIHNVTNLSKTKDLKLYTIYSPPHHPDNLIERVKKNK